MKPQPFFIALFSTVVIVGCDRQASEHHEAADEQAHVESGVTFSAKRGLHVPAVTAEFLGLEVADVEERQVRSGFRFAAQVYRGATDVRIASLEPIVSTKAFASGDVSPEDARVLRHGQGVVVQLDRGATFPGHIAEIEPHTDKATVEHLDVTVAIDDEKARLAAGTFVNVRVPIGSDKPVASVPRSALLKTAEGHFVYTVSGEHFVRTAVKPGVANNESVEITDGLYAGDKIVVTPVLTLWMAELQALRGGKSCADGH